MTAKRTLDPIGTKYGLWTLLAPDPDDGRRWVCKCECGTVRSVPSFTLKNGESQSCRCVGAERFRALDQRGDLSPTRIAAKDRHGENYVSPKNIWYRRSSAIFQKCKKQGIPFGFGSLSECASYLIEISVDACPVFGFRLEDGVGNFFPNAPSVDRLIPKLGYVRGNLQIISLKANVMKADADPSDLEHFARWVLGMMSQW